MVALIERLWVADVPSALSMNDVLKKLYHKNALRVVKVCSGQPFAWLANRRSRRDERLTRELRAGLMAARSVNRAGECNRELRVDELERRPILARSLTESASAS